MLINLSSFFYDCMPWFFYSDKNTTKTDLANILKDITSIDFSEIQDKIVEINKIRNTLCHNTETSHFSVLNDSLKNIGIYKKIDKWEQFELTDTEWQNYLNYFLSPFDTYFGNLIDFFSKHTSSTLSYDDTKWCQLLKESYCNEKFLRYQLSLLLPEIYDLLKTSGFLKIIKSKDNQVKIWRKQISDIDTFEQSISKLDFLDKTTYLDLNHKPILQKVFIAYLKNS